MIHANRIVTVGEQESIIDRPIVLYRGDREVEIEFTLVGNEFTFSEEGNVIKSVNASHGQLVLNTPSGEHMFSELAECREGKVVFVVTKEMIDEFIEMGFYSFQIRLYDSAEMKSRVTIPPVMNGFDIRNPIAAEDETNAVDQGIVDYARIFKDQSNEELPTFDWKDNYVKTEWVHHDVITENKLNKIEDALYSINANIKETDMRIVDVLDNVKKDADAYVKEHIAEVEADVAEFERNINTDVQKFKIDTTAAVATYKNEVEGYSGAIENINSQLEDIITLANDDIQEKLNKGGHIKLIGNINLTNTLYIKDNTILEMDTNSKIVSNFDGVILQIEGSNVEIRNTNIDCNNKACTGIFVNSNSKDITIKNNSVKNSYGGTSKVVYGIFISAIGCKNVVIDNNVVDSIISNDDGSTGKRDGGWAKGILVDLYDLIKLPSDINQSNISQNIIISNNQISNISDVSDADGIYIEGYKPSLKNNIIIKNNSLYNCHKRFIKVLNASNVQILNNYAYNDDDITMHAHISLYSSENIVTGNTMLANSRYGVELGYQSEYEDYLVKDIIIDSNKFDIHTEINYGAVICRGDFTGRYKDIVINNNILVGGRRSIFLTNGSDIEIIKITNNTCRNLVGGSCFVEFDKLNIGQLNIENNRFITDSQVNNIVISYPSSTEYKVNTCIISNNISSDSIYSAYNIKYVDNLILADNKINSSIPYALVSVTNSMIRNNYNLKTSLPCEVEQIKTFECMSISSSTIVLDISSMSQVYSLKVVPSVATTLASLTGNAGQIVNIISANSTGFTINHSNDIHLKNNTNITLNSMEQCITLIKLDNRWLEISRNF